MTEALQPLLSLAETPFQAAMVVLLWMVHRDLRKVVHKADEIEERVDRLEKVHA